MRKYERELGMKLGTARNVLLRNLMFRLVQDVGRDTCYRCGCKINSVEEFSIDHTEEWRLQENAKELYFDLDKIAFSHLSCNSGAARRNSENISKQVRDNWEQNKAEILATRLQQMKDKLITTPEGLRMPNVSGYLGVFKGVSGWRAAYALGNGKKIYCGTHPTPVQAACAYDSQALLIDPLNITNAKLGLL